MAEETTNTAMQAAEQENTPQNGGNTVSTQTERTFTQAELDRIVGERLAKVKGKTLDDEEFSAYQAWKKTQKTEAQKQAERENEFNRTKAENAQLRAEKKVISVSAKPEFAEFVAMKVLSMGNEEFDANLAKYKKDNPQYFGETVVRKTATAPSMTGGGAESTTNEIMNNLLRNRGN